MTIGFVKLQQKNQPKPNCRTIVFNTQPKLRLLQTFRNRNGFDILFCLSFLKKKFSGSEYYEYLCIIINTFYYERYSTRKRSFRLA